MRINYGIKTYLYPQPVLILATYDEAGKPNAMNAAWGGICDEDKLIISLGKHKTTDNIALRKAFTVCVADAEHTAACDYLGIVSGADEPDKLAKAGLTVTKSEFVDAPVINELPISLECELYKIVENGLYIGTIKNVSADERFVGEDGKPDLTKFTPITFDPVHCKYVALGKEVGNAFSDGKQIG